MSAKYIHFFIAIVFILLASCKTKQYVNNQCSIDSLSKSEEKKSVYDNITFDVWYPGDTSIYIYHQPSNEAIVDSDFKVGTIYMNKSKLKSILPILPGTHIKYTKTATTEKQISQNTAVKSESKKEEKREVEKNPLRQNVVFYMVLVFFICLIVRNSKKIEEKFGR